MTQTLTLSSLTTIPDNIEVQLRQLMQAPRQPELEAWLFELIKSSGHLSTPDALRWRVVAMVWLAVEFDIEKAWPYLMWLNTGQPALSEHLAEILSEAANDLDCHVELTNWIAQAKDARLVTFLNNFHPLPARYNMPDLVRRLLNRPTAPEVGVWLAAYCRDTAGNSNSNLRPWRLFTAVWYATCFDSVVGLEYLRELNNSEILTTLSKTNNQTLTDLANELNCVDTMRQWIGLSHDPNLREMLKDFGHPDLPTFAAAVFQQPPNYQHLTGSARHAERDAQAFRRAVKLLEQAGVPLKNARLLDLACGPLAAQTLLFNSAGYKIVGADLHIPPAYLPTASLTQRLFQRGKYTKAWETATAPYYQALAQHAGLKLKWNGIKIELADLTRLPFPDNCFEAVACLHHLHHAPDVESLLAEAAHVLQPGGVLVANIIPYSGLNGAFSTDGTQPWSHLRGTDNAPQPNPVILNRWRERQYRLAFEKFFQIEQWQAEANPDALAHLTPTVKAELTAYAEAELTCHQIFVLARRPA